MTQDRSLVKIFFAAALAVLALAVSVARPATASAATPCWKALLNDWYDGRIDNTYPLHCYNDALRHLPTDVQTYSSARDDILRALQNAKTELRKEGKQATPTTPVPPAKRPKTRTTHTSTNGGSSTTTTTPAIAPGRTTGGGLTGAAASSSSSPSSVPVPLIILGALALLLVAAGAAGLVAKRRQGRNPPA